MRLPFNVFDLSVLFALLSIILLITVEFLKPSGINMNFILDKNRIKRVAIVFGSFFLVTIFIRIFLILLIE